MKKSTGGDAILVAKGACVEEGGHDIQATCDENHRKICVHCASFFTVRGVHKEGCPSKHEVCPHNGCTMNNAF